MRVQQRSSSQVDRLGIVSLEDSTQDVNGASLLGTGLRNEVGEYNCFLNVIIQVGSYQKSIFPIVCYINCSSCISLMYDFLYSENDFLSLYDLSHCGI
jgi:hypothetical protein